MEERLHKIIGIIGIIGSRENAKQYLSQMNIAEDVFSLNIDKTLEDLSVMEWLIKRSKEIALRETDEDTLLGMLEFADLDKERDYMTGQLQGEQKRRLQLLEALLANKRNMAIWDVFDGLGEGELEKIVRMLAEFSVFSDIILLSDNDKGFSICDELIYC